MFCGELIEPSSGRWSGRISQEDEVTKQRNSYGMSVSLLLVLCITLFTGCTRHAENLHASHSSTSDPAEPPHDPLITGKSITPDFARASQDVGSLPMNMVLTP